MSINSMVAAAGAAKANRDRIFGALADSAPDYSQIAKESVNQSALDNVNAAANNALTADARIRAESSVRRTQIKADNEKDIRGIKKKARMTGMLAGGAALLGIGAMQLNKKEEADPTLSVLEGQMTTYNDRLSKANQDIATAQAEIDRLKGGKSSGTDTTETTETTETMGVSTGGSSKPISSAQFDGKKGTYSVADMTRLAEEAGFTPDQARVMGAIGMAESGGRAGIDTSQTIDPGKNNEYSIGLFQVNAQAHGDKLSKLGYSEDDLRDPRKAAKVAKMVYDEVGSFKPWSVFKSGDYTKYLPK